jgi:cyclic pyranopterin phosphate synthase
MPREVFGKDFQFLPKDRILDFEEVARFCSIATTLGVRKIRLTGGEPLLRHELPVLVGMLSRIQNIELALTTNGTLLARHAQDLAEQGLDRVTVSLDALDDATFQRMCDTEVPVATVLDGIEAARAAGLPVKINAVVRRGVNEHSVVELARRFKTTGHIGRFIEFMDVGSHNAWSMDDVVPGSEIVAAIDRELPLEPAEPNYHGEVARRWRYRDGSGEIGVITSVTQPFCGDCGRARLSADGHVYTCLFAARGTSFRERLRDDSSDEAVRMALADLWNGRSDRYSELRSERRLDAPKVEMSYIGG